MKQKQWQQESRHDEFKPEQRFEHQEKEEFEEGRNFIPEKTQGPSEEFRGTFIPSDTLQSEKKQFKEEETHHEKKKHSPKQEHWEEDIGDKHIEGDHTEKITEYQREVSTEKQEQVIEHLAEMKDTLAKKFDEAV